MAWVTAEALIQLVGDLVTWCPPHTARDAVIYAGWLEIDIPQLQVHKNGVHEALLAFPVIDILISLR